MLSRREALALSIATVGTASLPLPLAWAFADEDPTRVFTPGLMPTIQADYRLGPPKTLDKNYYPFSVPKTKEAWELRRKQLREQLLVATGLWPMPEKTPLNAVIHGKIDKGEYTIEKVYFASMPGHYVSGNLYRPVSAEDARKARKYPGVLFAHGHWANGRLHDDGEKLGKASMDSKGEPDMDRGRYFMQALPATLAKLGFVVFHYDMVGVADSTALPHGGGFADVEGELRLQSAMGLQTWNSIRSLDFISSLPDVDPKRLGMTGASGGGTQTFMLAAIDDRLTSAFPAVMVSTDMQGGCVCENCSHLRVNTGNVEIAAIFAPKPQGMSAANDWTKDMMTKGYPELQQLYDLYGAKDKIAVRAWLEYGHQYNVHSRQMMYSWFLKYLQGKDEEVKEPAFKPVVPTTDLSVYDTKEHARPKDELKAPELRKTMTKVSDEQITKLSPKDAESLKEFKRVVGTALRVMIHSELPKEIAVRLGPLQSEVDGVTLRRAVVGRTDEKDAVPAASLHGPKHKEGQLVVWLHPKGKASLIDNGKVAPAVKSLLDAGYAVVAPDLLGTGENVFHKEYPVRKDFAGYTYGYNRTLLAQRVHDALTVIALGQTVVKAKNICVIGSGEMGVVALLAKALAGEAVTKTAADLNLLRFEAIKDVDDPMMLPGAVKYGGLGAFVALCAPGEVLVHNHRGTGIGILAKAGYDASGVANKLTGSGVKLDDAKVIEWVVK
jgi:dienelactone hydrolase